MPDRRPTAPTAAALHDAAMNHLARYAATEAGLRAVLERRIDRWFRAASTEDRDALEARAETLRQDARRIAARMVESGLIDDAAYARTRAAGMVRAGRSSRAVAARLLAKGIGADIARSTLPDDPDSELDAALVLIRKRRIGPFRTGDIPDAAGKRLELAILARAGFARSLAVRALGMTARDAETRIAAFRR